ncbi:MAG: coproporphyrinogen dehydrogenase HemZ, partial [Selenomonadaceae bacterium]
MKIKSFYLSSDKEVIVKIVKEILTLFKVEISEQGPFDYERLEIVNEQQPGPVPKVTTSVTLVDDVSVQFSRTMAAEPDERPGAALHRMIKLNLYHIFVKDLGKEKAPWGILHGVRPTKIVHRYIGQGL